jgi:hypothetical protein
LLWFSPTSGLACSVKVFSDLGPLLHLMDQIMLYVFSFPTPPSKTQPIAIIISKQVVSYRTHGGTCCPGMSTPNIRFLADLSTSCHDGNNHLHHSNLCANLSSDPHTITSHLDECRTTTLNKPQAKLNIMKDVRLARHSRLYD